MAFIQRKYAIWEICAQENGSYDTQSFDIAKVMTVESLFTLQIEIFQEIVFN
jgi:hypothetical protein